MKDDTQFHVLVIQDSKVVDNQCYFVRTVSIKLIFMGIILQMGAKAHGLHIESLASLLHRDDNSPGVVADTQNLLHAIFPLGLRGLLVTVPDVALKLCFMRVVFFSWAQEFEPLRVNSTDLAA